jgi:hypothetical protein
MRKDNSHQSLVTLIMREKHDLETEEETEQHSMDSYLSYQSSDSIDSDDSTNTIIADNGAVNADNRAIVNTGHTVEHVLKVAADNINTIQNANVSFNLV